ncbi:MAG TPA: hypothetical protein VGM12_09040 [Trebonia sp.]
MRLAQLPGGPQRPARQRDLVAAALPGAVLEQQAAPVRGPA